MSLWYLVLLAIVQGFTEFLPISSSAHLVLLPRLLEVTDQGLAFDVAANTGTLAAAVVYFRSDLARLLAAARGRGGEVLDRDRRLLLWLGLASLPVLLCGLLLRDAVATLARDPLVIATTSIGFGVLLAVADMLRRGDRANVDMTRRDAMFIGVAQAMALVPGVSRSGVTMTAGLWRHFGREEAARFSFLLAIPVGAAAAGYEALGLLSQGLGGRVILDLGVVVLVSAVTALLVIHLFLGFVRRRSLTIFVIYRVALGVAILVLAE